MGFFDRLKAIAGAKLEKGLDAVENPKEMLDFSLVKMEESLRATARSALDVGTAKKRLEMQRDTLEDSLSKYEEQARKALELGQEDLAREALARKQQAAERSSALAQQIAGMEQHLEVIARSQEELKRKIESFRLKKEELKALYDASEAQMKIKEVMTSVGSEAENIGRIIERAEGRVADMRARVAALDELVAQGVVAEAPLGSSQDDLDRKLSALGRDAAVDKELARLKTGLQAKVQAVQTSDQLGG